MLPKDHQISGLTVLLKIIRSVDWQCYYRSSDQWTDSATRDHQISGLTVLLEIIRSVDWQCYKRSSDQWTDSATRDHQISGLIMLPKDYQIINTINNPSLRQSRALGNPFYWHGLTLIPAWISNHTPSKFWDEIVLSNLQRLQFGNW